MKIQRICVLFCRVFVIILLWNFTLANAAPSGYRLPFNGSATISNGPGEGYHSSGSAEAIDLALSCGTSVYATQSGTVIYSALDPGNPSFGELIKIQHADGNVSYYGHLSIRQVSLNDSISQGQQIGKSGTTGTSTGCHLHFEVRKSGVAVCIRDLTGVWWNTSYDPNLSPPGDPNLYSGCAQYPTGGSTPGECRSGARTLSCGGSGATDKFLTYISPDTTKVYWIQNNKKYHVIDSGVLNTMHNDGISEWNWPSTSNAISDSYSLGPNFISSSTGSDGLLIQQGGGTAVYAMENGKRRWIKSPEARDWMGTSWANDVITVSSTIIPNYVPNTGNDIYGVGEGETDTTIKNSFKNAYTTNANDSNCLKPSSWQGWPGTFSDCLRFPIGTVGAASTSGASGISGRYQKFGNDSSEYGTINYCSKGTYPVYGAIYTKYKELGYSASLLGFPTSAEYQWGSYRRSDFEGGYIYWNSSNNQTIVVTPVNGTCGLSSGGTFTSAPAANLCSAGSATSVTGSGPWSWSCNGSNGGTTANCSANIQTWTVTPSAGSDGSISPNSAQTANHGSTKSFTVTPNYGYTASVGGTCGGTLSGNTYTTNPITGNCTVSATFSTSLVNGACGSSSGGTFTSAPAANLCGAGSATSVTGSGPWSWSCNGSNGGTTASCSANIQTWTVTPSAGSDGSISPNSTQTANHGSTKSFTVTPNYGYTASVGGTCGGTLSGNTYTTNPITGNCTVSATFSASLVNGTCGSSSGGTFTSAPAANLCSAGSATSVTGSGPWSWSCNGSNGGTNASCSANILIGTTINGDINGDGTVNLADAVLSLSTLSGLNPTGIRSDYASSGADANGNNKVGIEEVICILQNIAGLRSNISSQQIYTIQPGPTDGKDTFFGTAYLTGGSPNLEVLHMGGWEDYYYDFIEVNLTGSPSAANTISAKLYLYGSAPAGGNNPAFQVYRITSSWAEASVNLANNPASVFYKNFGPFAIGTDTWNSVDITDLYKDWKNGLYPNYGIKLVPTNNNHSNGDIASSNNLDSTIRPKIIILYLP